MTQFKATCDDCQKRYRVPSEERTYRCKSCGGDLHADSTKLAKQTAASNPAPKETQRPGFAARLLGFFGFGRGEKDTDAIDPAASLDSLDWDAFGAPPLAASDDPMKAMPAPEPALPAGKAPWSTVNQASAPAPVPSGANGALAASSSSVSGPTAGPKVSGANASQASGEADDSAPSALESHDLD